MRLFEIGDIVFVHGLSGSFAKQLEGRYGKISEICHALHSETTLLRPDNFYNITYTDPHQEIRMILEDNITAFRGVFTSITTATDSNVVRDIDQNLKNQHVQHEEKDVDSGTRHPSDIPTACQNIAKFPYKFSEGEYIEELKKYVDKTYGDHYATNKIQSTEVIIDRGNGTGFCMGNVDKYSNRYGKKGTRDDHRKDLMKILHYTLIQLHVHDNDL
jgi:hypothetical protein